jgi:hypothetical protein
VLGDALGAVLALGVGVNPLGSRDGISEGEAEGDGEGEGLGVSAGAAHSVPGRYSSFSELTLWLELDDGEADDEALGDGFTLLLFWQAGPETRPLGCWKVSTLKFAWLRPLSMKSRRTELPTIVP